MRSYLISNHSNDKWLRHPGHNNAIGSNDILPRQQCNTDSQYRQQLPMVHGSHDKQHQFQCNRKLFGKCDLFNRMQFNISSNKHHSKSITKQCSDCIRSHDILQWWISNTDGKQQHRKLFMESWWSYDPRYHSISRR